MSDDPKLTMRGDIRPPPLVSTFNREFIKAKEKIGGKNVAHVPTNGSSLLEKIGKAFGYITGIFIDLIVSVQGKKIVNDAFQQAGFDQAAQDGSGFLTRTILQQSALMTNWDMISFTKALKQRDSEAQLDIGGIRSDKPIDPLSRIQTVVRENSAQASPKNIIAYPYLFPSTGKLSFNHFVLVVVDLKNKKIFYYDPQGKTSDDPSRPNVTKTANMHQNLTELARQLSVSHPGNEGSDPWTIIENTAKHQSDAINCGNYVMRALFELSKLRAADLANPDAVLTALSFNPEAGEALRRRIGMIFASKVSTSASLKQ